MIKRYKIIFKGSVQGVGFRWTACNAASMYRLTGYVRNEYDGSVTCEVQGKDEEIDRFIAAIQSGRFIDITDIERRELPVDEEERGFDVKF